MNSKKIQLALLVIIIFLAYSNIFQNQFLGDDLNLFANWPQFKSLTNIGRFFFEQSLPGDYAFYRPVGYIYSALNYYLWGINPFGYHLVQLMVHIVNVILVYFIAEQLVKHANSMRKKITRIDANKQIKWLPLVTALVFGVHPVNIEVVGFMVSQMSIGYTFFLASFLSFLKAKEVKRWYFLSVLFAALAFFSYELTLTLPIILILADWILIRGKSIVRGPLQGKQLSVVTYLPYFSLAAFYLFVRYFLLHVSADVSYPGHSFYLSMLLSVKIVALYLFLLVLPIKLSINHTISPGIQSLINPYTERLNEPKVIAQSIFDADVILGLFVIMILLYSAFWCRRKHPIITFAIGLFAITLLPVLNFIPQSSIFQERYAYLASIGWGLILGYGVVQSAKLKVKSLVVLTAAILIISYASRTFVRNMDWKDEISMWSNLASQLKDDGLTQYHLASLYQVRGEDDSALKYYERTLRINPNVPEVYFYIGQIYEKGRQYENAKLMYNQALGLNPSFEDAKRARDKLTIDI